jgi:hypothetical protein
MPCTSISEKESVYAFYFGAKIRKKLVLEDTVFKYVVLQCSSSKNWSPILSS